MTVETSPYLSAVRRMITAAGRRTADADEPELTALLALRGELDSAIRVAVAGQLQGRSWAHIARATGTTRQGAFQQWGPRP